MSTTQHAAGAVYRTMPLTPPEALTDDELVEVTVAWGDDVLSVSHLRRGEGLTRAASAHLRARVEGRGASCAVTVPEGASAWVLRDGAVEERAGSSVAVEQGACVCVARDGLTMRVRRVSASERLPGPRRVTRFGAAVTCALALATTGAAWASRPARDGGAVVRDDTDARRWIAAHVRPWPAYEATRTTPVGEAWWWRYDCCCFCTCMPCIQREERSPYDARFYAFDTCYDPPSTPPTPTRSTVRTGIVSASGPVHRSDVRRVLRRHLGELQRCVSPEVPSDSRAHSEVAVRFVIGGMGDVMAAGVASSSHPSASAGDCIANAVRRWQFPAPSGGGIATVDAAFKLR